MLTGLEKLWRIRNDLFPQIVDEIPIVGESPSEQETEALGYLPNLFVELSPD
jgi:hypothetical protein